jgi:hypothetical protein
MQYPNRTIELHAPPAFEGLAGWTIKRFDCQQLLLRNPVRHAWLKPKSRRCRVRHASSNVSLQAPRDSSAGLKDESSKSPERG